MLSNAAEQFVIRVCVNCYLPGAPVILGRPPKCLGPPGRACFHCFASLIGINMMSKMQLLFFFLLSQEKPIFEAITQYVF